MDIGALKPLFGQRVVVVTSISKEFVGTLLALDGSKEAVKLVPLDAADAANYQFAINGVAALSIGVITFVQLLSKA